MAVVSLGLSASPCKLALQHPEHGPCLAFSPSKQVARSCLLRRTCKDKAGPVGRARNRFCPRLPRRQHSPKKLTLRGRESALLEVRMQASPEGQAAPLPYCGRRPPAAVCALETPSARPRGLIRTGSLPALKPLDARNRR